MKRGALLFALALVACGHDDVTVVGAASAHPSASAVPVDHLASGELLEGSAKAFGLVLPRRMKIDAAFADVVYASGPVESESLVRYVRARVREGKLVRPDFAGDGRTTFDHVKVPAMPDKEFVVTVGPALGAIASSSLEIRDVTPQKGPSLPDETARWRNAGLAPNGAVADPTHLQ
ncbi:MAG TPA: hypothetical protein VGH28_25350 [Polyangiaceae bacterium]|jgi:hypothetical protein